MKSNNTYLYGSTIWTFMAYEMFQIYSAQFSFSLFYVNITYFQNLEFSKDFSHSFEIFTIELCCKNLKNSEMF